MYPLAIQGAVEDVICGNAWVGTAGIVTALVMMPPIVRPAVTTLPAAVASSLMDPLPVMSPADDSASPWIVAEFWSVTVPLAHTFPLTVEVFSICAVPLGT